MYTPIASTFAAVAFFFLLPAVGVAKEPQRDLTIELRQIREGQDSAQAATGTYTAGPSSQNAEFAPQQVRVRSGEKASLQIQQSIPMQWIQKIELQSTTLSAASASASSQAGGVTQGVVWMESGQNLSVTAHWSGGKQPAQLEIEVQSATVDERNGADLPATRRQRVSTTMTVPLDQWITIASSGRSSTPGTYSSTGSSDARRHLQVRVTAH